MMKLIVLLTGLMLAATGLLRAEDLTWQFDYDKALADAKEKKKPVLLDFFASWCGPCRLLESNTFTNSAVQEDLDDYILVKVDLDQNAALAAKYRVQAIPALFLLNQFGETVAKQVGYADVTNFRRWLGVNSPDANADTPKSQLLADQIKTLGRALELPDVTKRNPAVDALMEIYGGKAEDEIGDHSGAKSVMEVFRGYVQRQPGAAAAYLNDRRLAVRILFAGLFGEKFGADFRFDPWAKSDRRAADVAIWAKAHGTQ